MPVPSPLSVTIPTTETTSTDVSALMQQNGPFSANPQLVILTCLLITALLTIAYVAAEIILPLILAFVLHLLFQPAMRLLEKLHLPRSLAAFGLVLLFLGLIVAIGASISGPATAMAEKLPDGLNRIQQRLYFFTEPLQAAQSFLQRIDGKDPNAVGIGLTGMLFRGTQSFAGGLFETLLVLFFLLVSGDTFLRRLVEVVPRFSDKRQVVMLSKQIESNVSAYLLTISMMNMLVGIATGAVAWATGLGDAAFWGVIGFALNYVPIIGPFAGVVILGFTGVAQIPVLWQALLPAGLYLIIHLIEGEFITPMLLARRFTLNPVLVIISLVFWFWMWGIVGAILAVPLLAIFKIICDGIQPLNSIGHFLEG